jgi:hypothetical protein
MGHRVTGIIGRSTVLETMSREHSLSPPVALIPGVALLPLNEVDLSAFQTALSDDDSWQYLSAQLLEQLLRWSRHGSLMYFETEYFGGLGGQGAVVAEDGKLAFGPRWAQIGPINEGLRLLGVSIESPAQDEFETVGLHLHRETAGWLKPR